MGALRDILLLGGQIGPYQSATAGRAYTRFAHSSKVLALAFLYNGNMIIVLEVYNSAIKFEVASTSKLLAWFSKESGLV